MSELQEALLEIPDNESGDFLSNELPALPPEFLPMMGLADWSGAEGARDGALGDVTQAVYDISSEEGRNGRAEGPSNGGEESDDDVAPPVVQTSSVMTRPVVRPVPVRPGPKAGPGNPSARPKRKSRQKKR